MAGYSPPEPSLVTTLIDPRPTPVENSGATIRHASPKPPRGRTGSHQHKGHSRGGGGRRGSLPRPINHRPLGGIGRDNTLTLTALKYLTLMGIMIHMINMGWSLGIDIPPLSNNTRGFNPRTGRSYDIPHPSLNQRDFQKANRGGLKRNGDEREGAEGGGIFTPKRRRT